MMSTTCLIGVVCGGTVITRISDIVSVTISLFSVWNQWTIIKDISKTCPEKQQQKSANLHIHIHKFLSFKRYFIFRARKV